MNHPGEEAALGRVRILEQPEAPDGWADLVAADPRAEYTHTEHWSGSVASLAGAHSVWLTLHQGDRLVGGLAATVRPNYRTLPLGIGKIRRTDSQVEGTAGGALVAADLPDDVQDRIFLDLTRTLQRRRGGGFSTVAVALGHGHESRFGHLMKQERWVRRDNPTAAVSLDGGIESFEADRMSMNKRNERNRGLRRGAEVFASRDPSLLEVYYRIYEKASWLWGSQPTPLALLLALLNDPSKSVFFTCVRVDDRVIGGHLCLHHRDRVFAWNGVTDPEFAKTHFPGTLCMWGDAVEACRRRARWLDLGGSGQVDSLLGFKKFFGAVLQERGYYTNTSVPLAVFMRAARFFKQRSLDSPSIRWHDRKPDGSGS